MEQQPRDSDCVDVRIGSRWQTWYSAARSAGSSVQVEDVDTAMDSVTVRWLAQRRPASKRTDVEVGDMVQALEDGAAFEAGNVGVVTGMHLDLTGSRFFGGPELIDITWLGSGFPTGEEFRRFFHRFKLVGYRATSCMSLTRFLRFSKPWPSCSECNAQFETHQQLRQHTDGVHRGQEHRYRKPKTKKERWEVHLLRTIPLVLTVQPTRLDDLQVKLSCLTLSGTEFISGLDMLTSETVSDLSRAIRDRPEFELDGGHRRLARLLLQDGREFDELDQQSPLATVVEIDSSK